MYMYMYICMYVFMYVCMYVYIHSTMKNAQKQLISPVPPLKKTR